MILRLACLAVTNTFAAPRLPPMGDRDNDAEILALRHQITDVGLRRTPWTRARKMLSGNPDQPLTDLRSYPIPHGDGQRWR